MVDCLCSPFFPRSPPPSGLKRKCFSLPALSFEEEEKGSEQLQNPSPRKNNILDETRVKNKTNPIDTNITSSWVGGRLRSRPSRMTGIAQCKSSPQGRDLRFGCFCVPSSEFQSRHLFLLVIQADCMIYRWDKWLISRCSTFLKRKGGLFKKAHELSVLCSVDVAVIIFGHNKKLYEYSSGDINDTIGRFQYVSCHFKCVVAVLTRLSMVAHTNTKVPPTSMAERWTTTTMRIWALRPWKMAWPENRACHRTCKIRAT